MPRFNPRLWVLPALLSLFASYVAAWQHNPVTAVLAFGCAWIFTTMAKLQ